MWPVESPRMHAGELLYTSEVAINFRLPGPRNAACAAKIIIRIHNVPV
jgi:hypothetical protein